MNTNILCLFNHINSEQHVLNDRIHLECVLSNLEVKYDYTKLYLYYKNLLYKKNNGELKFYYLFNIWGINIESNRVIEYIDDNSILVIYNINLDIFLGPLLPNDLDQNFTDKFTEILGQFAASEDYNLESIYTRSVFIFKNLVWSTVVLKFKLLGIDISGGNTTNRHILNQLEFKLSILLFYIYNDSVIINNILYKNKKDPLLKNKIPLELYEKACKILGNKTKFLNFNVQTYLEDLFDKDFSKLGFHNIEDYLIYNFSYAHIELIENIKINLANNIEKIKKSLLDNDNNISNLEKDIQSIKFYETNMPYGSVNVKKSHKNLKTQMKNDPNRLTQLSKLEDKLIKLNQNKENITIKLEEKEKEFLNLDLILKNKSFEDLNELYNESLDFNNSKQTKLYKNRFLRVNFPMNVNKNKRNYSTSLTLKINRANYTSLIDPLPVKSRFNNSMSLYFKNIEEILHNENMTVFEKQQDIENLWINIKKDSFINKETSHQYSILFSKLRKAEKTLELLYFGSKIKKNFPNAYEYLYDFNLVLITYMVCQDSVIKNWNYTNTTRVVGNKIIQNLYFKFKIGKFTNLKDKERNVNLKKEIGEDNLIDYNSFCEFLNFKNNEDFIKLGNFFIDILTRFPSDIFESEYKNYNTNLGTVEVKLKYNEINPQENLEHLIIEPFGLPMVCPPNTWSDTEYGGFLNNKLIKESIISGSKHHNHKMLNKTSLYNTINSLSKTEFKINLDLFKFLIETKEQILQDEIFKGNLRDLITFTIAKTYSNHSFFLPTYVDWRGRIYVNSHFLSYQGNDFSVSLLEFNKGEKLTNQGLDKFYIYGANLFNENGVNKKTFQERIDWVIKNKQKILDMNINFLLKAENKWTFIAFCLNMRKLEKDPNSIIYTPVFLDATCSGIQHLAAIIKDEELGAEVNLIKQDEASSPGDLYSKLLVHINNEIQNLGKSNPKYSILSEIALTRKIVKKPIMTKTYNSTIIGMKDSISNAVESVLENKIKFYKLHDKDGNVILVTENEILQIAKIIYNSIYIQYPGLKLIFDYFIDMVKAFNQLDIPIQWMTPAGVKIIQYYNKTVQNKIAIYLGGKSRKLVLQTPINSLDKRKQTSSLIPNVVHSLDAAHIMNLVEAISKKNSFSLITVHDCFGSHPNNIPNLNELVLSEFIKLYTTHDFLKAFHETNLNLFQSYDLDIVEIKDKKGITKTIVCSIEGKKKVVIPNLPLLGKLNLNDIKESKHFIT